MPEYAQYKDAGRLEKDYSGVAPEEKKPTKTKKVYPRICIDSKNFPFLRSMDIGKKCEVKAMVKKVAESEPDNYEVDKDNKMTIEIIQISEPKTSSADYKEIIKEGKSKMKEEIE
ncbi:MAG: hypothetical protein WC998_05075 [Candidatus Paceibacterota bacterium]|jgi:hypothetical protein